MTSKQIMFFTVLSDIEGVIRNLEGVENTHYFKTGLFDSKIIPYYNSIFDSPNLGFVLFGDWNRIDSYLVMPKTVNANVRDVPQISGGTKYAIDQLINPKCVVLKLGGILMEKENVIVAGRVATVSNDDISLKLFNFFSKKIKKEFKRIGNFYVGREAEAKLKQGWRLVTNEKLSREFDLTIS